MIDTFLSSSKLLNTFAVHSNIVWSIDYSTFACDQLICSGSNDNTVRVWNEENNKEIQTFNEHSDAVSCVKFSQYYYHNYRRNVICSASADKTIRFWDFKSNQQLQYLCSVSSDKIICLWDIETSNLLHSFKGHDNCVRCVDISPLQSNNNKSNNIGVIGGNGYTICSGSYDNTIRIWDIETTKQFI
ncbi:WD-repeat protein, partial [Reticulomyxa filosa]